MLLILRGVSINIAFTSIEIEILVLPTFFEN